METLLWTIVLAIAFIWLVDGIKIFLETFSKYHNREFESDPKTVTAIIPCFNEEKNILKTLYSLVRILRPENIIVADDGSTDHTVERIRESGLNVRISAGVHGGKVAAIKRALKKVLTPYVLLWDADSVPGENFSLPTSLLEEQTAVAFNVMPVKNASSRWGKLLNDLQSHEYAKSMQIGRRAQDKVESVHCVSGAAGLFRTDRLSRFTEFHSGVFPGEDLERTLIELVAAGRVVWVDRLVKTAAPPTFRKLAKQRILGWWPGLWRNLLFFFIILFKKGAPWRLRLEMAYQLFCLITDPLKIISLIGMVMGRQWLILGTIFSVYFILEVFVYFRMRNGYLDRRWQTFIVYPFYNLVQMAFRIAALPVFIWRRMIKMEWKGVQTKILAALVMVIFCSLPNFSRAENEKWEIQLKYQIVQDSNKTMKRTMNDTDIFISYQKKFYLDIETSDGTRNGKSLERLNIGGYFKIGDIVINPDIRIREHDVTPKVTFEKPLFKPFVGRISYAHVIGFGSESFPAIGAGMDYYYGDYNRVSFDIVKEFGRKYGSTFILKNHLQKKDWWLDIGGAITNFGDPGVFGRIGYKWLFLEVSSYKKYDYEKFDRTFIGMGIKLKFK